MRLPSMKLTRVILALSLLAGWDAVSAQSMPAGSWAGFWKFIPAKSTFPGPPPKVDQFTIAPDGTVHIHEMSAEGKVRDWYYTPQAGHWATVEGRGPNVTVLVKKVNAYRIEHVWNFNGASAKSYSTLSKDGKIQIFHIDGMDKDGKSYHETAVYKRTKVDKE